MSPPDGKVPVPRLSSTVLLNTTETQEFLPIFVEFSVTAGFWRRVSIESGPDKESLMILDVPEMLILGLTAMLLWLGGKNWLSSRKR